jgi:hypothetical protein
VNDAFLKQLAEQQRGQCFLQTPDDDIAGTVAKLGAMIRRPVFTDIAIDAGWTLPMARVPDLFSGQIVDIPAVSQAGATAITFTGRLAKGAAHVATFQPVLAKNRAIELLWARAKIDALLLAGADGDAIALAKRHNILCRGAAFIAWDEQEQVTVATQTVYQPAIEMAGFASAPAMAAPPAPGARYRSFHIGGSGGISEKIAESVDSLIERGSRVFKRKAPSARKPSKTVRIRNDYAAWRKIGNPVFVAKLEDSLAGLIQTPFFAAAGNVKSLLDILCFWVLTDAPSLAVRWKAFHNAGIDFLAEPRDGAGGIAFWRRFVKENIDDPAIRDDALSVL